MNEMMETSIPVEEHKWGEKQGAGGDGMFCSSLAVSSPRAISDQPSSWRFLGAICLGQPNHWLHLQHPRQADRVWVVEELGF